MMFTILTKPISWKEKLIFNLKKFIKFILNINTYWPKFVINSIILWLKELNIENDYNIDPDIKNINKIVFVPNWVETLKFVIWLKKKWVIDVIIAWPNISTPLSKKDIFFNKEVNKILIPSKWVKDYFLSIMPNEKRLYIWPSWVIDKWKSQKNGKKLLIYKKNCPTKLYNYIINLLDKINIPYETLIYWDFKQNEYLEKLNCCCGLIYLQELESQWLALLEAWMKDIPTLIWNKWYWEFNWKKWVDEKISAPYLSKECGIFFKTEKDFDDQINIFYNNIDKFTPRKYSLKYFTNKITTKKLLTIIE